MNSELIAHTIYKQVLNFLEEHLANKHFKTVAQQVYTFFPTWNDAWKLIHHFLAEHPLTHMQKSIHSFAQLFPNYSTFANELDDSLALHDEFWNQVHRGLCIAKSQL